MTISEHDGCYEVVKFLAHLFRDEIRCFVVKTAKQYTAGIFRRLREHEYDPKLMKLYVVGGGGCLIRNFADYDENRVTVNDDICATAKGYERMLEMQLLRGGGRV